MAEEFNRQRRWSCRRKARSTIRFIYGATSAMILSTLLQSSMFEKF